MVVLPVAVNQLLLTAWHDRTGGQGAGDLHDGHRRERPAAPAGRTVDVLVLDGAKDWGLRCAQSTAAGGVTFSKRQLSFAG